jgi:hypothetical protein
LLGWDENEYRVRRSTWYSVVYYWRNKIGTQYWVAHRRRCSDDFIYIFIFLFLINDVYRKSVANVILTVYKYFHFWILNEFLSVECWMGCVWMFLSLFECVMAMHCVTFSFHFALCVLLLNFWRACEQLKGPNKQFPQHWVSFFFQESPNLNQTITKSISHLASTTQPSCVSIVRAKNSKMENEAEEQNNSTNKKSSTVIRIPSYQEVIESSQTKSTPPSLFVPSQTFSQAFAFVKSSEFYSPPPSLPKYSHFSFLLLIRTFFNHIRNFRIRNFD